MNPSIKKLPRSVQYLICGVNQINSYTKAVQELVYNSLDADATSIAVRIHIAKGSIQVIDNGCGILQADLKLIGQNHMTSKVVDISVLESAPNKYGFQGQSLANLIQVSECLKVTSRFNKYETTHVKSYENGKAKSIAKCSLRPSKGTTIDIKGFLYNLNIQKRSVNPINELQGIKTFLEHISLLHTNVSLSLRDDSKRDIVFKIHKNRDMYQTLSTLYDIDKSILQELQVEKNQYRVKAYVGNRETEETRQLIFLNGKIAIDSSSLHKKVNDNFRKYFIAEKKVIKKNGTNEDENLFGNNVPFYFIFLTCPYMDYELTSAGVEFKDWKQMNILLDKLVKFSNGDNLKLKPAQNNQVTKPKTDTENNRNHIEEIMRKILGNHSKITDIAVMQKGIKGRLIKRKPHDNKKQLDFTKDVGFELNKPTNIEENSISASRYASKKIAKTRFQKPNKNKITKKTKSNQATSSKILTPEQIDKQKKLLKKQHCKKICSKNKISLSNKFAMGTESVKKRCDILAQKTKELINCNNHLDLFIKDDVQYTKNKLIRDSKKITIRKKVNEVVIHEYIPLRPKTNVGEVANNGNKQFNSNYDLLHTILTTQQKNNIQEESISANNNMFVDGTKSDHVIMHINKSFNDGGTTEIAPIDTVTDRNHVPLIRKQNNPTLHNTETLERSFYFDSRSYSESFHPQEPMHANDDSHKNDYGSQFFKEGNANDRNSLNLPKKKHIPSLKESEVPSQLENYLFRQNTHLSDIESRQNSVLPAQFSTVDTNVRPDLIKQIDYDSPFETTTYQSHNYKESRSKLKCNFIRKTRNFITTQSRENFTLRNIVSKNIINKKRINNNVFSKHFRPSTYKRTQNKSTKMFDLKNNTIRGGRESCTIEFTESNKYEYTSTNNVFNRHEMLYSANKDNTMTQTMSYIFNDCHRKSVPVMNPILVISRNNIEEDNNFDYEPINNFDYEPINNFDSEPINENTFIVNKLSRDRMCKNLSKTAEKIKIDKTYTVESSQYYEKEISGDSDSNTNISTNFVFKSQEHINEIPISNPIDVCEAVLNDYELSMDKIREFDTSFNQRPNSIPDNLNINSENVSKTNARQNELMNNMNPLSNIGSNELNEQDNPTKYQITETHNEAEVSRHFSKHNNNSLVNPDAINLILEDCKKTFTNQNKDDAAVKENEGAFSLRNRLFFVPKGLSPIFKEHQIKLNGEHDPNQDYYEDNIYNEFAHRVKNDAEMFKPRVQETNDLTTKDISKVNTKLKNDNASIKFDGFSIRNANILGQVDNKFIAAIMEGKCHKTDDAQQFLVLFDQHAVHERIRLENNLSDYLTGSQWKSVPIDEVTLKMSRDNILYLHNYREKFTQFGLEWTILTYNEISVTAIPEGILGKNFRQVDKIIKAVKNLIKEEINIIQIQSGCVSLYPKSIMDLVFSEACRYAIKFGDHLSKCQCSELLKELATCKSPFQCAHGRPAMAVITNIERKKHDFKVNLGMLQKFNMKYHSVT